MFRHKLRNLETGPVIFALMRVTLKVLAGPHAGRTFSFDQHETFLIGRSEKANLCLPDDRFFSRNHCMIEIAPPQCFLRDLGSTNGTYVNGRRVQQIFLKGGDVVHGGHTTISVEVVVDQPAYASHRAELQTTQPAIVLVNCLRCGRTEEAEAASPDEKLTFICEDCRNELRRQPQPIPGYEILKVLGRGGMGNVSLARSTRTGDTVAIKTLLPEVAVNDQAIKRFIREIDVAAALSHPNIVKFLDRGVHNGVVYLVTEFVNGEDAARLADSRGGKLPAREAVVIVVQTLDALAFAHDKGFVHRDIKDQNILVSGEGQNRQVKLTDFGLAKNFKQSGMSGITMAGDMAGTYAYMPPEQIRDFQNAQPSSDIYAVGMTAYSLLTGQIALDVSPRPNAAEIIKAIFEKPTIPLRSRAVDVPEAIASIVERAIDKEPSQRWHTAAAMRAALHTAASQS